MRWMRSGRARMLEGDMNEEDRRGIVAIIDDLVREHRALTLPLVNDLVDAMAGLLHASLEAQKARMEKDRGRLRSALAHEIYRNHEHTNACSACEQNDALLRYR